MEMVADASNPSWRVGRVFRSAWKLAPPTGGRTEAQHRHIWPKAGATAQRCVPPVAASPIGVDGVPGGVLPGRRCNGRTGSLIEVRKLRAGGRARRCDFARLGVHHGVAAAKGWPSGPRPDPVGPRPTTRVVPASAMDHTVGTSRCSAVYVALHLATAASSWVSWPFRRLVRDRGTSTFGDTPRPSTIAPRDVYQPAAGRRSTNP